MPSKRKTLYRKKYKSKPRTKKTPRALAKYLNEDVYHGKSNRRKKSSVWNRIKSAFRRKGGKSKSRRH